MKLRRKNMTFVESKVFNKNKNKNMVGKESDPKDVRTGFILMLCVFATFLLACASVAFDW